MLFGPPFGGPQFVFLFCKTVGGKYIMRPEFRSIILIVRDWR